jgi:hypothetical protein
MCSSAPSVVDSASRSVDPAADPARGGEDVVGRGPAGRDQLVADAAREGQVGQVVAVEVAELLAPVAELDAAEPVRRARHAGPGGHLAPDRLTRAVHR